MNYLIINVDASVELQNNQDFNIIRILLEFKF